MGRFVKKFFRVTMSLTSATVLAVLGHERATATNNYLKTLGITALREAMALLEDEGGSQSKVATKGE